MLNGDKLELLIKVTIIPYIAIVLYYFKQDYLVKDKLIISEDDWDNQIVQSLPILLLLAILIYLNKHLASKVYLYIYLYLYIYIYII